MPAMPRQPAQVRIDVNAAEPVYRQIAAQLRVLIVEGAFRPGDALPPVRKLARDLAVHFNTVAEAFRLLASEGWLDVSHGRAARVVERPAPKASQEMAGTFREGLRRMVAETRARGLPAGRIRKELKSLMEALKP